MPSSNVDDDWLTRWALCHDLCSVHVESRSYVCDQDLLFVTPGWILTSLSKEMRFIHIVIVKWEWCRSCWYKFNLWNKRWVLDWFYRLYTWFQKHDCFTMVTTFYACHVFKYNLFLYSHNTILPLTTTWCTNLSMLCYWGTRSTVKLNTCIRGGGSTLLNGFLVSQWKKQGCLS